MIYKHDLDILIMNLQTKNIRARTVKTYIDRRELMSYQPHLLAVKIHIKFIDDLYISMYVANTSKLYTFVYLTWALDAHILQQCKR